MKTQLLTRSFLVLAFCVAGLTLVSPTLVSGQATPGDKLSLPAGFKAELLYTVPNKQGSWVSITHDPKGRLIASDQYGGLYRITPTENGAEIEEIELRMGFAQGLLCAFDSLYVCLLYTSPSPRDRTRSRMPSSA